MKKVPHYVPVRLDSQTMMMLQELVKQSGKNNKSAVIRAAIQELAKITLTGKP